MARCTTLRCCALSRHRLMIAECRLLIVEVGIRPSQINNHQSSIVIQFRQPIGPSGLSLPMRKCKRRVYVVLPPEGRFDNSPAMYRWVTMAVCVASPVGTTGRLNPCDVWTSAFSGFQPSLRDCWKNPGRKPRTEVLGYYRAVPSGRVRDARASPSPGSSLHIST